MSIAQSIPARLRGRMPPRQLPVLKWPAPHPAELATSTPECPAAVHCQQCQAPARLQLLQGYQGGAPVYRRLCLACARAAAPVVYKRRRTPAWSLLALAGAAVLIVGLCGDWLIPDGHAGFGLRQQLGGVLGLAIGLLGLLTGVEFVALAGAFLLGAAITADWFGFTRGPGIGTTQQAVIWVGLLCMLSAALWRWIPRFRDAAKRRDAGDGPQPAADVVAA